MTTPEVYIAACSQHGGHPAAALYALDVPQYAFLCRKCSKGLIPADEVAREGAVVILVDYNPGTRWVVLRREDETITVRVLGMPDSQEITVPVGQVRPEFSYRRMS